MRVRLVRVPTCVWLFVLVAASIVPAWAQDSRVPVSPLAVTSSPFQPPDANDYTFVINDHAALDTGCTFRSEGPLRIGLPIRRVLGDIARLKQNGLVPARVRIEFPAFDVDSAVEPGAPPERDRVSVNGNVVPGTFMSGLNDAWVMQRFDVPIEWLRFPSDPGRGRTVTPESNEIRVDIDTLSAPEENWCTAVDWVAVTVIAPIPPRPWVGAHGIFSAGNIWNNLWVPQIRNLGLPADQGPDMGRLDSIQNNAGKIGQTVRAALARWGVDKVNIVAHSKGGLDARHYIEANNTVEHLVQLGTPNAGSPLADAIQSGSIRVLGPLGNIAANLLAGGVGGYQLTTPHMRLYNLFHGRNARTSYLAIAGNYQPGSYFNDTWRRAFTDLIVGPGDTIVPITSVHALGYMTRGIVTSTHPDRGTEHIAMHGDLRFFNLASGRVRAPGARTQMAPAETLGMPDVQRTESMAGRLTANEVANHPVPIDGATTVAFALFASNGDVALTLTNPLGAIIDPGSAGVSYEKSEIPGGWIVTYGFEAPVPAGTWTAHVRAGAESGVDYTLNAWLNGADVQLAGSVSPEAAPLTRPFVLRAALTDHGAPVTGATARAFVLLPDGVTRQTVTLVDDGTGADTTAADGVYSGAFVSAGQVGVHHMAITASGTTSAGLAFSREAYTQLGVSRSDSEILPGVTDVGRDVNGNARFEHLVLHVPLRISAAGTYLLAATLSDAAGNELDASATLALPQGDSEAELLFDGTVIFSRGVDGPYTVTSLRLAEEIDGQIVPLSAAAAPHATQPYRFTEFEGPGLSLAGGGSAQGVDLDGNGLFDLLRVSVGVNVQTPGGYSWSARLRDRTGREIILGDGQGTLAAGRATLVIEFPGLAIGRHGIDGPYQVTDLLLLGAGGTLSAANVLQTPALPASAFEGFVAPTGTPRITGRIRAVTSLGASRYQVDLEIANTGTGVARDVFIRDLAATVLAGAPTPPTMEALTLPVFVGDLDPTATALVPLVLNIPTGVTRVRLSENGTVVDGRGQERQFATGQAFLVPVP